MFVFLYICHLFYSLFYYWVCIGLEFLFDFRRTVVSFGLLEMGLLDIEFLSQQQLAGFDKYKYSCIDNSPLSVYISHPIWDYVVQFYPRWLAPNVLTLAGAVIVMGCYALVSLLDYDLNANSPGTPPDLNIPPWVWLLCSLGTYLAHLLDGTDGKQARRTGASGPTGELFDHGFDSWSTIPFTLTIFSVFGRGEFSVHPLTLLSVLVAVQLVFIVSHWEKYNTGVLFLSWGYDASQYGLVFFYMLTYFVGHRTFHFHLFDGAFNFAHVLISSFYVSCLLSLITSLYNIYFAYAVEKTGKQNSVPEALLPLLSPLLLFSAAFFWAAYSPQQVLGKDPRAFFWTVGVVFSNIAVHLIIAQMSQTRVQSLNKLLLLYILLVSLSIGKVLSSSELFFLRTFAILFTVLHLHFGICVIRQLCNHFHIQPFSLAYLQKRKK